ncbi:MAG: tetratricopeptide repeat protein [Terracidiphilus sp.]
MSKPFSHIDDNFHTRAMAQEFKDVPATRPMKKGWEHTLELERQDAARSHGEAAFIMQDFNATRRPFVLFLRSFEVEAYNYLTPEDDSGKRKIFTAVNGPSRVEQKLKAALAGRLKTISIANPAQMVTSRLGFPRLMLRNEGWEAAVENLVEHAHFIVMDCYALAPGVLRELEFVRAANRQSATIIVLPPANDSSRDTLRQTVELFGGIAEKLPDPLKDNPEFAAFPRIASEDEIGFDHLDDSPVFADLLASASAATAAAPPFDAIAWARGLNNEGVELFNNRQYVQAMELYTQALVLRRCINDRSGLLTSLINVGCVHVDTGQPAEALATFEEALPIARELNRPDDEALLIGYIAMTNKQLGPFHKAWRWLTTVIRWMKERS